MGLTLDENTNHFVITAYQPGLIQINQDQFTHSVILSAQHLIRDWQPQKVSDLTPESFQPALGLHPTVLIIGTGENLIFLKPETYAHLLENKIGVEVMSTSAACRTFNVLSAEGRNAVACLLLA